MTQRLEGKVAIVTGGGSGKAICHIICLQDEAQNVEVLSLSPDS
jgi:NAD(P)-dependent dehydrogenase (short-subunit alcohol dehydrogenase family)